MKTRLGRSILPSAILALIALSLTALWSGSSFAATAEEINARVNAALGTLPQDVPGGQDLINQAAGVLLFPQVTKAGLGIGGEFGEGALLVRGKTVDYYSIGSASFGFQAGAQRRSILIAFMTPEALEKFERGAGFKIGGDMSVAVLKMGASGQLDTSTINKPVVGIVYGEKGLMYNLTLEGSKITKLKK